MSQNHASKRKVSRGRALALLPLSLLTVAGCAQIIGLGDYTVASDNGGGGTAGAIIGGKGGTNSGGKSGAGGKPGTAGNGTGAVGEAGTGEAGVGGMGEGGVGGAGPAPQNLGCDGKTTFSVNTSIIRSCILRAGCSANAVPLRTISECVSKNTQQALPGESCNLTSQTCDDYNACEHGGIAHDDLCGGTKVTRCQGGLAVNCGNYSVDQFTDCKAQGMTCGTFMDGGVTYADCEVPVAPATACAGMSDDQAYYCQPGTSTTPDAYYYCYNEQAYGSSCSKFASCIPDTTGAEPDASCYFTFPVQCKGQANSASCPNGAKGVAKTCSAEDVISYDCPSVGLNCATKGADGYCVAPGCTPPDVDNCVESCGADGTTLNFCYGGVPYSVDCTTYGFSSCQEGMTSADTPVAYASCR